MKQVLNALHDSEFTPTSMQYCMGKKNSKGDFQDGCKGQWVAFRCDRRMKNVVVATPKNNVEKVAATTKNNVTSEIPANKTRVRREDSVLEVFVKDEEITENPKEDDRSEDPPLYSDIFKNDYKTKLTIPTNAKVLQSTNPIFLIF